MRVLLIGSGGREHALALSVVADPAVEALVGAPGNPGIGAIASLRDVEPTDPAAVAALAVEERADLVVIGPEAPLVAGVADAVRAKVDDAQMTSAFNQCMERKGYQPARS